MIGSIGRVGQMIGRVGQSGGTPRFSPFDLGASLYDLWDAERAADLSLSGAQVTAWRSARGGQAAVQAVGAARPIWSATALAGRPGVVFDGADDELTLPGVGPLPVGSAPCEIWVLADQATPATDTAQRALAAYGGDTSATQRRVLRDRTSGANRGRTETGDGSTFVVAANAIADFSGRLVARGRFDATTSRLDVNGAEGSVRAVAPATGSGRLRIGAVANVQAGTFFRGTVAILAVTAPLTQAQASRMLAYLKTRGDIV